MSKVVKFVLFASVFKCEVIAIEDTHFIGVDDGKGFDIVWQESFTKCFIHQQSIQNRGPKRILGVKVSQLPHSVMTPPKAVHIHLQLNTIRIQLEINNKEG